MKLKSLFILSLIIASCTIAQAQFNHSVGGSILSGLGKLPKGSTSEETPTLLGYGVFYFPRYNFTENENSSISVGVPLTLGLNGSVNSREGGSINLTADIPVTVDLNFGAASSVDNESGFGGFIGAGFGYTYTNQTFESGFGSDQLKGISYGPLAHAGLRAYIGNRSYFVRAFGKMGLEKESFKTFGLSFGINLGY